MKNNIISESGTDAVYFVECNNVNFENNKIINSNNSSLGFVICRNIIVSNNEIHMPDYALEWVSNILAVSSLFLR